MSSELKRSKCLEEISGILYRASPDLLSSGRYLKALRQTQNLLKNDNDKMKYEYMINRGLQKHIIYLQESIMSSLGKEPNKSVSFSQANKLINLANSELAIKDNRYSLVNIEGLKKMKIIKKAVILKDELVLPCKVKSEDAKYKFNTQIIMTKDNVLSYASYSYECDNYTSLINHNVLLNKIGKGIKNNELLTKNKETNLSR